MPLLGRPVAERVGVEQRSCLRHLTGVRRLSSKADDGGQRDIWHFATVVPPAQLRLPLQREGWQRRLILRWYRVLLGARGCAERRAKGRLDKPRRRRIGSVSRLRVDDRVRSLRAESEMLNRRHHSLHDRHQSRDRRRLLRVRDGRSRAAGPLLQAYQMSQHLRLKPPFVGRAVAGLWTRRILVASLFKAL